MFQAGRQVLIAAGLVAASFILTKATLSVAANFVIGVDALTRAALEEGGTCTRSESTGYHSHLSISDGEACSVSRIDISG
jgi:hypothetical protein